MGILTHLKLLRYTAIWGMHRIPFFFFFFLFDICTNIIFFPIFVMNSEACYSIPFRHMVGEALQVRAPL